MGREEFHDYYKSIWGERWPAIYDALKRTDVKVPLHFKQQTVGYELDPASLRVAQILDTHPGDSVLDMCAAPGGKSLASIFSVEGRGQWVLNDLSQDRVHRLKRVLQQFVPEDIQPNIRVTRRDASRWGLHEKDAYDRVLVDAPCSGERHLLESEKDLDQWSRRRGEGLTYRQYALLCAALDAAKPGGRIVYSTCSLNPIENDGVIDKLLRKKGERFQVIHLEIGPHEEPTVHGRQILPDTSPGWGPIYFCALEKK